MKHEVAKTGRPLNGELLRRVSKLVDELGPRGAARALGINDGTLGRACAGFAIAAGSRALIELGLQRSRSTP